MHTYYDLRIYGVSDRGTRMTGALLGSGQPQQEVRAKPSGQCRYGVGNLKFSSTSE